MQIVIDISNYDKEWITNGYYIPKEINMKISRAIANGTPLSNSEKSNKWIPVSKKLPEIKQHVLLSCYDRAIYGRMISENGNNGYPVFEIYDSVDAKRPIVLETTAHSEFTTSRIKAWMPLPEPFKAESEDEE